MKNKYTKVESDSMTESDTNESYVKRCGFLNEFFWICSGANREILRQCPTEYSKYFGIGGTIFFTAAMAFLSGGYAFYTIFHSQWLAIAFGLFWGLLIFNLDRLIVNTMYSDGKHTISWRELYAGAPRLVIAFFLGIVISTPLELKVFEDEINVEIENLRDIRLAEHMRADSLALIELQQKKDLYNSKIDNIQGSSQSEMYVSSIQNTENARDKIDGQISAKNDQLTKEESSLRQMRYTLSNTTDSLKIESLKRQIANQKTKIKNLNKDIETLQNQSTEKSNELSDVVSRATAQKEDQISEYKREISVLNEDIKDVKDRLRNSKKEYKVKLDNEFNGFQAHMLAFDIIKKKNETTKYVSWFIMAMFVVIEMMPTFFKMMMASGPYDELLNEEMHRKKVKAVQSVSNLNDEVNTQIKISTEKNRNKMEAEIAANKQLLERVASVQAELLETAIEEWRKAELEKIHANPSEYIKSNTKEG